MTFLQDKGFNVGERGMKEGKTELEPSSTTVYYHNNFRFLFPLENRERVRFGPFHRSGVSLLSTCHHETRVTPRGADIFAHLSHLIKYTGRFVIFYHCQKVLRSPTSCHLI